MKNNGYFFTYWLYFWNNIIKNSILYRTLCALYSFISNQWKNSRLTGVFRRSLFSEDTAKNSIWGKICFSPFLLMEKIHSRYSEKLNVQKEKSVIIRFFKFLLHNFLALNLRFLGVFIGVGAAFDFAISFIGGGSLKLSIIAMVVGSTLCFLDVNVTSLLKGSVLIHLLEKCLDAEFSFNFYYITKCEGNSRLLCAGVFGAICGIICGLTSPI